MATIIGSGLEGYLHRQARRRALNLVAEAKEEAQRTLDRANAEIEAPTASTSLGPNWSVSRPDSGAPTPEARPRMITR